jgi:S1-C subfamily serine protease
VASGVVISEAGDVLSVRIDPPSPASPVVVRDATGRRLPAQWVAADPETGLTLLKIPAGSARPAVPAASGPRLGTPVLVIGNPFGLGHSVGRGAVAGLGRRLGLGPRPLGGLIQVDAALHPGDSGALLADLRGGWLGVIRSGLATPADHGPDGDGRDHDRPGREYDHDLGFAIPAAHALWVADQLRTHGRVERAYLGVTMGEPEPAPGAEGDSDGATLDRVLADTPAAHAGLRPGDRVVALDGRPVRSPDDLTDRLDRTPADAEVTVDVARGAGPGSEVRRLTLRTARRPDEPPRPRTTTPPPTSPAAPQATAGSEPDLAVTVERLHRRLEALERREPADAAPSGSVPR